MVAVKGAFRVYDFVPEELELIYHFWLILDPETKALAQRIEETIESWLRD